MKTKPIIYAVFISALLMAPVQALCGQGYTVTLVNGNTLSANSYTIGDGRINLKFPVGEAGFNLSEVASIKDDAGNDMLFQEKGVYVPPSPAEAAASRSDDTEDAFSYSGSALSDTGGHAVSYNSSSVSAHDYRGAGVKRKWEPVYYSVQTEEIDDFVDAMFEAEERGEEISDEEVDRAFSAFFEEDEGQSGADWQN